MKKKSKQKTVAASSPAELGIEGILVKIHEQLVNLEKKIDGLTSRVPVAPQEVRPQVIQLPVQQQQQKQRILYEVICADCNKMCEVPFKPSANRPVYCKPCFTKRKQNNTAFKSNNNPPGPAPSIASVPAINARPKKSARKKPIAKKTHGK